MAARRPAVRRFRRTLALFLCATLILYVVYRFRHPFAFLPSRVNMTVVPRRARTPAPTATATPTASASPPPTPVATRTRTPRTGFSPLFLDTLSRWANVSFSPPPLPPANGSRALCLLVRNASHVPQFIRNSRSVFTPGHFDVFYVFQEDNLSGSAVVENVTVHYVDVSDMWRTFPPGFDPGKHSSTWTVSKARDVTWGYHHMCRFFSLLLFDMPVMRDIRYYMRLDLDSCLRNVNVPPASLINGSVVYVWDAIELDPEYVVRGLRDLTEDYVAHFGIVPKSPDRWAVAFSGDDVRMYGTNFEIMDLMFWRKPEVQKFIRFIDLSWGQFLSRWGDAPIRYLALALFATTEQVVRRPEDWRYNHYCHWNLNDEPFPDA
jgi:hypothetical protein